MFYAVLSWKVFVFLQETSIFENIQRLSTNQRLTKQTALQCFWQDVSRRCNTVQRFILQKTLRSEMLKGFCVMSVNRTTYGSHQIIREQLAVHIFNGTL